MQLNIYVCALLMFACLLIGHIIGYLVRRKEEKSVVLRIFAKPGQIDDMRQLIKHIAFAAYGNKLVDDICIMEIPTPTQTEERK